VDSLTTPVVVNGARNSNSMGLRLPVLQTTATSRSGIRSAPTRSGSIEPTRLTPRPKNALAEFLLGHVTDPRSPGPHDPDADLICNATGSSCSLPEVKSVTDSNEEKHLRLGLGQGSRYRQLLSASAHDAVVVLVAEGAARSRGRHFATSLVLS
jgi:hypothetical protein